MLDEADVDDGCEPEKEEGQGEEERGEDDRPHSSSSRLAKI